MEIWFGIITRRTIRRGSFRGTKDLAEKIPDAQYSVVPMCGHFGPNHRPDIYNKLIMNFLEELHI